MNQSVGESENVGTHHRVGNQLDFHICFHYLLHFILDWWSFEIGSIQEYTIFQLMLLSKYGNHYMCRYSRLYVYFWGVSFYWDHGSKYLFYFVIMHRYKLTVEVSIGIHRVLILWIRRIRKRVVKLVNNRGGNLAPSNEVVRKTTKDKRLLWILNWPTTFS